MLTSHSQTTPTQLMLASFQYQRFMIAKVIFMTCIIFCIIAKLSMIREELLVCSWTFSWINTVKQDSSLKPLLFWSKPDTAHINSLLLKSHLMKACRKVYTKSEIMVLCFHSWHSACMSLTKHTLTLHCMLGQQSSKFASLPLQFLGLIVVQTQIYRYAGEAIYVLTIFCNECQLADFVFFGNIFQLADFFLLLLLQRTSSMTRWHRSSVGNYPNQL